MNQFPVAIAFKSAGEEYGFTQEFFIILLQTDEFFILTSSSSCSLLTLKADCT